MGESQRANMMGQRVFIIIALMASLCVALPTTDLVVPEAKDAGTTGAKFVQSTLKSGGTETTDFLETQDAATNLLSLHAPAMLDELATLSKEAHTSGQTTAIKQLKHVMVLLEATPNGTATDGGTKKLADRVKTMRDVVQSAIVAMQSGLDSDFTAALADLSTLLNVINSTVRTVETSEQTSIKLKAHNWCIAKEAKDNSTKKCRDATTNVTNFDPAIAVNDAFYKHIGSITDCPAGTALVDGKCPAGVVNLDESTLKAGFQDARDAYHELDVTKTSECGIKTVDEDNEGTNQTAYETTIATILDDHVAACNPDSTVYTTAVTSFNTNNGHRAAMYKSLDKIKCYVNNIDNSADAAACISALSTDYATKYTDHTTAAPTCPTRAVYALQISNYESLSLTESWEPSDVANTCADLAAPSTILTTGTGEYVMIRKAAEYWPQAKARCEANGMILPVPNTLAKWNSLVQACLIARPPHGEDCTWLGMLCPDATGAPIDGTCGEGSSTGWEWVTGEKVADGWVNPINHFSSGADVGIYYNEPAGFFTTSMWSNYYWTMCEKVASN